MEIALIYRLFKQYPLVVTDTRKIVLDSLFFALKGDNFNGNKFALSAIEKGCRYAIVDEEEYAIDDRFILVNDVLTCLQNLARMHRRELGIPILAITGTNGKTTTKELIFEVLKKKFNAVATVGNLNNHIGVPLTLLSMTDDTEFGIVEMGANHPKEIKFLCKIVEPNYGLITNVGKAHLEGFGSFEGVIKTKKELYDYMHAEKGKVFVNTDNSLLKGMLHEQEIVSYGNNENAFSKAKFLQAEPFLVLELRSPKIGKLYVKTKLIGAYNFENALAAVSLGRFFEIDEIEIKNALEEYLPSNNRSQLKQTGKNVLFLDAYNANPSSMKVAVENFTKMTRKNKVLILGDMLELGKDTEMEHVNLLSFINEGQFKDVYLVGDIFCKVNTNDQFKTFSKASDLIDVLEKDNLQNQYILIKGSRGIRLEQVIEKL